MPISTKPKAKEEKPVYIGFNVPLHVKQHLLRVAKNEHRNLSQQAEKILCDWYAGEVQTATIDQDGD